MFLVEVYLFCTFSPALLEHLTGIDIKYLTFTDKQRRVVHNIQRQNALNLKAEPVIYILGGSTSREFFPLDAQMKRAVGHAFVNMSASNQTLIDSLRLVDNVKGDQATIVYCLFPMKLMRFAPKVPADSRYLLGAYLKYPVASPAIDELFADVEPRNLATALMTDLNVYCYLLKNYVLQKNYILQYKLAGITTPPLKTLFINNRPPHQHFYHRRPLDRNYLRQRLFRIKKEIGPHLEDNLEINFRHLGYIVELARQHGHRFKLLELPYSSTYRRMYQRELGIYRQHLKAFLQKYSRVPFARIDYEVYQGSEKLFYDHGHLLDPGREYFYPLIEPLFEENSPHAVHN
jgi:hypothetical protein